MQNEIAEGRVLVGKYRIERVLGRGGMGIVVAAHHIQLDEKVAIKFLLPEAVSNAEVVQRFVREARAAVRIKSEHVARVSDVGTLEGGEPYMVMEYLEGCDLAAWLQQHGALPIEQAVEFVLQACEAIAEAHALGIVHRDLKPANLFVVRRADGLWSVKVLDFGISKVAELGEGQNASLTRTTAVMGSPLYMPPEQMAASRSVDGRADIWSLGVILYELMAAHVPFSGVTLPEVCMKIAMEAPHSIRDFRPDVPQALEAVVVRCLEKERERRYPNVAELAHELLDFGPKRARSSVERITRTIQAAGLATNALLLPPASERSQQSSQALDPSQQAPKAVDRSQQSAAVLGTGSDAPWGRTTSTRSARKSKGSAMVLGAGLVVVLGGVAVGLRGGLSASVLPLQADAGAPVVTQPSALTAPIATVSAATVADVAQSPMAAASSGSTTAPSAAVGAAASPAAKAVQLPVHSVSSPAYRGPTDESTKRAVRGAVVSSSRPPAPKPSIFDDR